MGLQSRIEECKFSCWNEKNKHKKEIFAISTVCVKNDVLEIGDTVASEANK